MPFAAPEKERLVVIDFAPTDAVAKTRSAQLVLTEAARFERFRVLATSW